jgi:hypothetical protein
MKLVVCYGHGEEYSGWWEEHICVEAESIDHLMVEFIDACEYYALGRQIFFTVSEAEHELLAENVRRRDRKTPDDLTRHAKLADIRAWKHDLLSRPHYDFIVSGYHFENYSWSGRYDGNLPEDSDYPDVYTLEDWWEINKKHKVKE